MLGVLVMLGVWKVLVVFKMLGIVMLVMSEVSEV